MKVFASVVYMEVKSALLRFSGIKSLFCRSKSSDHLCLPIYKDRGDKNTVAFCERYTRIAAGVVASGRQVTHVFGAVDASEVTPPVVRPISVDVVNLVRGLVGLHGPYNSMRHEPLAVYANPDVSIPARCTGLFASVLGVPSSPRRFSCVVPGSEPLSRSAVPEQKSGVLVVTQNLAQIVCGRHNKFSQFDLQFGLTDYKFKGAATPSSVHLNMNFGGQQ